MLQTWKVAPSESVFLWTLENGTAHMDRSRYECPRIHDFHGFYGVFTIPSGKSVRLINPIAKEMV